MERPQRLNAPSSRWKTFSGNLDISLQTGDSIRNMQKIRMQRVNEALKEIIGEVIVDKLQDPRIGFVTVTRVETSVDLKRAKVFVSIMGDESVRKDTLAGLSSSHGMIQSKIARELKMKNTPTISFTYDDSVDTMFRIDELLKNSE